ncbi:hypothetical protein [Sciscionella marina]|nr:hypothetical protein [Sciscionella marina]
MTEEQPAHREGEKGARSLRRADLEQRFPGLLDLAIRQAGG